MITDQVAEELRAIAQDEPRVGSGIVLDLLQERDELVATLKLMLRTSIAVCQRPEPTALEDLRAVTATVVDRMAKRANVLYELNLDERESARKGRG